MPIYDGRMPRPRTTSRSRTPTKYAFPVVKATLDEVGPPPQIQALSNSCTGPLLVTLAMEIAVSSGLVIHDQVEEGRHTGTTLNLLVPDMFGRLGSEQNTAEHLLLLKCTRWWVAFVQKAQRKFEALARSTGPLRWMLRSCMASDRVNEQLAGTSQISFDAAWLMYVQNDASAHPPFDAARSLDQEGIRKWRSILNKEDEAQSEWIRRHAGPFHPCASSYWRESRRIRKPRDYSSHRARNELYYALSNKDLKLWIPSTSSLFDKDAWAKWLERAKKGRPPFYRHQPTKA